MSGVLVISTSLLTDGSSDALCCCLVPCSHESVFGPGPLVLDYVSDEGCCCPVVVIAADSEEESSAQHTYGGQWLS